MEKSYTLIVPMINTSPQYETIVPIEFQYDNKYNKMNCIKSIEGINTSLFSSIYFVILEKHEQRYHISSKITLDINSGILNGIDYHFIFLKHPTNSQAETIYTAIKSANITGPIFIKDTDNMCICDINKVGDYLLVYPLEKTKIVDPQHKSYIMLDDQQFIINIIEKRIIGNYFNCGGYCFNSAEQFKDAYEVMLEFEDINNHMYISHIIYWLMLNKNVKFRPIEAIFYDDFELKNILNENE